MPFDEARWLSLERRPAETLRTALQRSLRQAIHSGALRPGVRLPSSRSLADHLGISRGVVSDVYATLQAQGFLIGHSRAAPVVAALPSPQSAPQQTPHAAPLAVRYDLSPATPDVTLFPMRRWLTALQHVARTSSTAVLDYRYPLGERALREALADHLGRTRGAVADPDRILITQGTAQAVDLIVRVLGARGASRIAMEDPSLLRQHERVLALGLTPVAQPVDGEGLKVVGLDADAVLVTPAHQFPTGAVLSAERRRELLGWARQRAQRWIIEDEYDAEFRYDREPVRCLQGLDPGRVIEMGSVSKTLAPALRLGWLVLPASLVEDAVRVKRLLDDFSPALDQLTLANFLRSGEYDRHVRRTRVVYRARRDRMLAALQRKLPELSVEGIAAGMHLLLRLPRGVDDRSLAAAAERRSLRVAPLSEFSIAPSTNPALVIGYGRLHEGEIEPAINLLTELIGRPMALTDSTGMAP